MAPIAKPSVHRSLPPPTAIVSKRLARPSPQPQATVQPTSPGAKQVAIFGGGVGGLSAAHELAERGFNVTVYEAGDTFGGKARSMDAPGTATAGRHPLPGEHGFRFVPGFYKHLPDTMRRIPYARPIGGARSVADNLVVATEFALVRAGLQDLKLPTSIPTTLQSLVEVVGAALGGQTGLTAGDIGLFARKLLILLSSCDARRVDEWEDTAWWTFIEAASRSPDYQKLLGRGLTRSLVAMKAEEGSTRTVGYILLQLLFSIITPGQNLDRLLNGPTSAVWIDPWVDYLKALGVNLQTGSRLEGLNLVSGRVASASLRDTRLAPGGVPFDVAADYYISAVPVERMQALLTPSLVAAAPSLAGLDDLRTDWMNGIQLYLDREVSGVHGHVLYVDAPWALTSLSQKPFWNAVNLSQYGDGQVKGVISVDISDWETPGILYNRAARDCTREEIKNEVVAQMSQHINTSGKDSLECAKILGWHLDPDIVTDPPATRDLEPLMVNTIRSLTSRPQATTEIPNLLLASDYVRTHTDLATMEGANEAARRAVNALLEASDSAAPRCGVWPLQEPWVFAPLRAMDEVRYRLGMRNLFD